jgi:hypothetical protein
MKTASRQHYRTLPIFGSFIDEFATWLRHRGLSSSKVRQHLADLQRLAPWLLRRQKRPDDLSVDDINDAERCYRLRVPSLAAVIVVLGEFLQASGRLKSRWGRRIEAHQTDLSPFVSYVLPQKGLPILEPDATTGLSNSR